MRAIESLAASQHGLVTRAQLLAVDLSGDEIDGLLRRAILVRVHPGVYRLVGAEARFPQPLLAAILGHGKAWASHGSAARLLQLPGFAEYPNVEITVPKSHRHGLVGVRVTETRILPPTQLWTEDAVPTLSLGRTICDLAGDLSRSDLERLVDGCLVRRRISMPRLQAIYESLDRPRRRGRTQLKAILAERDKGGGLPESELEHRFLELVAAHGLPRPELQVRPAWLAGLGGRVDAIYAAQTVVVELDGRTWHERDADREHDLKRDHAATLAGWRVLRFSWRQVVHEGAYVAGILARALLPLSAAARSATG